jgi:glycosyltransferase involved in cell wall biosynthesis
MPLLTIAIPTYNRAIYLRECLHSLFLSLPKYINDIEIVVIDNNSTDDTKLIIQSFNKKLNIRYIKNNTNIGPDENFKKCIKESNGKFVWIFGDDDIFLKNSIESIMKTLKHNQDIGLLHLKATNFQNSEEFLNFKEKKYQHNSFNSKEEFIKKVHTNITFISANIFNTVYLNNINLDKIPNNNLGQVYWNIVAIIKAQQNILCSTPIFGARVFNSGNYNFCEVFGNNFIDILTLIDKKYNIKTLINIFYSRLLIFYYPANIIRLKNSLSKVNYDNNCFNILYKKFKFNIHFWLFTVPAIFLPKQIGLFIVKIMERLK